MTEYDVIIIGGGPAGLTAGLYTGRAELKVLMLERMIPGGQVASTEWIENYPGFPEGVNGAALMQDLENQARKFNLEIKSAGIDSIDLTSAPKSITAGGETYKARTVIIATGTDPKLLNVPGEKELKGRGVSYCATCDGPFFKDKDIAVVGGGSSGVQESLYLTRFVNAIHLVEFMDQLNAEKVLQHRARENDKFSFYLGHEVVSINGENRVESISIRSRENGEKRELKVDGVFIWVGLLPNTDFLKGKLELNNWNYIVVNRKMETEIPGVFAAGDVCEKEVRQITTAVADGTIAAESALKYIEAME